MEEFLKAATLVLAAAVEAAAALVIGLASLEAAGRALALFVPRPARNSAPSSAPSSAPNSAIDPKEMLRLRLGRWLAVALELELGADILRTAVTPTWTEIGQLGAIAALRTALNFFLQQEIDKAEARGRPGADRPPPSRPESLPPLSPLGTEPP